MRQGQDRGNVVLDDDEREAVIVLLDDAREDGEQILRCLHVESGEGLVQEEDVRIAGEGAAHFDEAEDPQRQRGHGGLGHPGQPAAARAVRPPVRFRPATAETGNGDRACRATVDGVPCGRGRPGPDAHARSDPGTARAAGTSGPDPEWRGRGRRPSSRPRRAATPAPSWVAGVRTERRGASTCRHRSAPPARRCVRARPPATRRRAPSTPRSGRRCPLPPARDPVRRVGSAGRRQHRSRPASRDVLRDPRGCIDGHDSVACTPRPSAESAPGRGVPALRWSTNRRSRRLCSASAPSGYLAAEMAPRPNSTGRTFAVHVRRKIVLGQAPAA